MSSPVLLLQRMQAHGLDKKVLEVSDKAQEHFNKAKHTYCTASISLTNEALEITMTPYEHEAEPYELFYMFEIASIDESVSLPVQQFIVYGLRTSQEIFGFLATQYHYDMM